MSVRSKQRQMLLQAKAAQECIRSRGSRCSVPQSMKELSHQSFAFLVWQRGWTQKWNVLLRAHGLLRKSIYRCSSTIHQGADKAEPVECEAGRFHAYGESMLRLTPSRAASDSLQIIELSLLSGLSMSMVMEQQDHEDSKLSRTTPPKQLTR
eukprot:5234173-Amphidinium_carterae.1